MKTNQPNIVIATAPKYTRRKKPAKPSLQGSAIVKVMSPKRAASAARWQKMTERQSNPETDAEVKAFFKRMMPNHPMSQDD